MATKNILPLPFDAGTIIPLPKPVTIKTQDEVWGSHFSHLGVGGFVELPNINYMYDIPVTDTLSTDKLSSGRRKLGMVVYLLEEKKYYQLRPKKTDGTELTMSEWNALSDIEKILKLDPNSSMTDDSYNTVDGSKKPEEAWVEVFTNTNSSGDDLVDEEFEVLGQNIGSYSIGDKIEKGEKLETVLKKILQKSVCPPYVQPTFSIGSNIALSYEIGTIINPIITPSWDKKNAGEWKSYKLYKNTVEIPYAAQNYSQNSQLLTSYTDPNIILGSDTSYQAEIVWEDGAVLTDNLNANCPGRILTNASNPKKSNTLTFLAKRAVFYTVDNSTAMPQASEIRDFTKTIEVADGGELKFDVGTTAKRIVIAFPQAWGEISSVIDGGTGYDIKGEFIKNRQIFSVEANSIGYATNYYVYTLTLKSTYQDVVEYRVTI